MRSPDVGTARAAILDLLAARAPSSSICPSDAARRCAPEAWRDGMDTVRAVTAGLADEGVVVVTQGRERVDVRTARGPIRIRRGPGFDERDGR